MGVIDVAWPHALIVGADEPRPIRAKSWNPTVDAKIARIAKLKLWAKTIIAAPFVFAAAILSAPIILIDKICDRIFGREKLRNELKSKFNEQQLKHLKSIQYQPGRPDQETRPFRSLKQFDIEVKRLGSELHKYNRDELRERLVKLSECDIYLHYRNFSDLDIPAPVRYLQDLALALESMDGTASCKNYGKELIKAQEPQTFGAFGQRLVVVQKGMKNSRNGWVKKCLWGAKNCLKAARGLWSHLDPLDFNPYRNQPVFQIPMQCGDRSIDLKFTPSLTGPQSLVEKLLIPAYKRKGKRWAHIDFQSTHIMSERRRINQIHQWSKNEPEHFLHAVLSSNTPIAVMKKESPADSSFGAYIEHICGNDKKIVRDFQNTRGIYIPHSLLNDQELNQAFDAAKEIVKAVNPTNDLELTDGIIRSVLFWSIMNKERTNYTGSTLSGGCRETNDRGPGENQKMIVLDLIVKNEDKISPEDQNQHGALGFLRSDFSMNRGPERKRPLQFSNFATALDTALPAVRDAITTIVSGSRIPDATVTRSVSSSSGSPQPASPTSVGASADSD